LGILGSASDPRSSHIVTKRKVASLNKGKGRISRPNLKKPVTLEGGGGGKGAAKVTIHQSTKEIL